MLDLKDKKLRRIIIGLLILAAIVFLVFNENGFLKYLKVKGELSQLEKNIRISEEKLKTLESEIDSLNRSKEKIERVAREKYSMMKKNEMVFRIQEN